jgi:hypothetical protein
MMNDDQIENYDLLIFYYRKSFKKNILQKMIHLIIIDNIQVQSLKIYIDFHQFV